MGPAAAGLIKIPLDQQRDRRDPSRVTPLMRVAFATRLESYASEVNSGAIFIV